LTKFAFGVLHFDKFTYGVLIFDEINFGVLIFDEINFGVFSVVTFAVLVFYLPHHFAIMHKSHQKVKKKEKKTLSSFKLTPSHINTAQHQFDEDLLPT
jgi:hypothetical protein